MKALIRWLAKWLIKHFCPGHHLHRDPVHKEKAPDNTLAKHQAEDIAE